MRQQLAHTAKYVLNFGELFCSSYLRGQLLLLWGYGFATTLWRTWQVRNNLTHYTEKLSIKALFSSLQNFKILQDFPSHRIFQHMHEILNVAKQNN